MKTRIVCLWAATMVLSCVRAEEPITAENFNEMRARYEGEWRYPSSPLASNVYAQVRKLYGEDDSAPLLNNFLAVRGGGIEQEMVSTNFVAFCAFVSNNCAAIIADWPAYETNEVVRFTTLSAIGYTGFAHMTNLADRVLAGYEADTNYCGWSTISFLHSPYGTRANTHYLAMNYEQPAVSNLISRFRALAVAKGDVDMRNACDARLSGEAKRFCLEMISIGDWW